MRLQQVPSLGVCWIFLYLSWAFAQDVSNTVDVAVPPQGLLKMDSLTDAELEKLKASSESYEFQAEVNRMMGIIINSVYTEKEVFIRELISNAADAIEKLRILSVTDPSLLGDQHALHVQISFNKENKTISIADTGIGMSKQDLINNLGTVAKSGTSNFLEALAQGRDLNLIGQFGVGFYSAFLVADKLTVVSKAQNDDQYVWESTADSSFTVSKDPRGNTMSRGTHITLHLKEDATDFLKEKILSDNIKRFSQFIPYPIYLQVTKEVEEEVPVESDSTNDTDSMSEDEKVKKDTDSKSDEIEVEEEDDVAKKEQAPKTKTVKVTKVEWEQQNKNKALWLRPKEEVTPEEYNEFYKSISKDFYTDPLAHIHFNAEGEVEFKSILYIPGTAPHDAWSVYMGPQTSIKLYVRRVLVAESFEDLMPRYLNFIKGVVDSDDLPLKVDRESLAQNKVIKVIGKKLTRKAIELIRKLAKDDEKEVEAQETTPEGDAKDKDLKKGPTKFEKFYKEFSKNLKLGCVEDDKNRDKLVKLLKFTSIHSSPKQITITEYVEKMPATQKEIYYLGGENVDVLKKSPLLQGFTKKGLDVFLLNDPTDESCLSRVGDYEGKKLVNVQKGDVHFDDESKLDKKKEKKLKELYKPLTDWWKDQLFGKIMKVEISKRLVADPVAVIASSYGSSAYMERIAKAQTFSDPSQLRMMSGTKTLEINPSHPIIKDLLNRVKENKEDSKAKEVASTLFTSGLLASGFDIENPLDLVDKLYRTISIDLGVNPEEQPSEVEVEVEPDVDEETLEPETEDFELNDDDSDLKEGAFSVKDSDEEGGARISFNDMKDEVKVKSEDAEAKINDEL